MGAGHHGDGPTRLGRLAIVTPITLLAGGVLLAGGLAGTSPAVLAAPAAASTSASSPFAYACGTSFTPGKATCLLIKNTAAHPTPRAAQAVRPAAIPGGSGYGPSDLQSAYGLTAASAADGAGTTVAVVDAFDDPTAASDLAAYRSAAGLPTLTSGQFTQYNQAGQTSPLPAEAPVQASGDWTEEESLDVDMVSAICPLCKIDLVEAADDTLGNLLAADLTAATTLGVKYISDSWGTPENPAETAVDSAVFSVPGVVYVAGAGESGYAGGVVYPAASPHVVAVGGTTLTTSSNSRGWTESVWDTLGSATGAGATGSGCSAYEPQPSWQASVSIISAACSNRVDNDVAADADPHTGAAVYDTFDGNGGWFEAGGTSESTPIIAAVFALAGNNGDGGNNAAESIYADTGDLNEVTASNNGTCPAADSVLCTATGAANTYNGPTGWGTPDGIKAFASKAGTGNTVTVVKVDSQTGKVGTSAFLHISATDSAAGQTLTFTATGLPAGLSIGSTGLISGTPTTAGTNQVTVTATDTTGASGSASFTWTINPAEGNGSSPSALAASASPESTCSSVTPSATPSATASATPSATASATTSATASATPTATSTSSTAAAHLTSFVQAASDCSASATPTPSPSESSMSPAPTPSAVSSDLAVTG
jgi:subtilase family serine protease